MKLNANGLLWFGLLLIFAAAPLAIKLFCSGEGMAAWDVGDVLGYYGSFLGAIATIIAVRLTIDHENEIRATEEREHQARRISVWFKEHEPERVNSVLKRTVTLQNASETPVYNVVVTCVGKEGAGPPHSGVDCGSEYKNRCCVSVLPPGLWEVDIPSSGGGMGVIVSLEVAFCDSVGLYWLRSGDGKIRGIDVSPVDYYGLGLPVSWIECRRLASADVS